MQRLTGYKATFVIVGLAAVLAVLPIATAIAIENGGIGAKPANPRADNPRTESIFVHEITPGQSITDAVEVINNTDTTKTLLVYAADSQVASGGSFACAQKADEAVSVGTWITLDKDSVNLAPNSTEQVGFTITAPKTASAGEQNGCIVIQDAQPNTTADGNGVALSFRSAIRIALTVPGDIKKGLLFTGLNVKKIENNMLRLSAGLKNNGNVSLDSDLAINLRSPFGQKLHTSGGVFPVLANNEAAFNFETKQPFWGGWYSVQATATYNGDNNQSLGQDGARSTIYSQKLWVYVQPQPVALVIELLGLLGLISAIGYGIWRHRHHKKVRATATSYTATSGDTLQSIAKDHSVTWKSIARINRLRAPYHIESGQKLKIPASKSPKQN